ATVTVEVAAVNDRPTATSAHFVTPEDTNLTLLLAGSDVDPGHTATLTFAIAHEPGHGTLSGFNPQTGQVTYKPALNYNGPDSFSFRVTDAGGLTSTTAAATLTVTPVNDAPSTMRDQYFTPGGVPFEAPSVLDNDCDDHDGSLIEGNGPLITRPLSDPAHGT